MGTETKEKGGSPNLMARGGRRNDSEMESHWGEKNSTRGAEEIIASGGKRSD